MARGVDVLVVVRALRAYPDVVDSLDRMTADGTLRGARTLEIDPAGGPTAQEQAWERVRQSMAEHATEVLILHHLHSPDLADPRPHLERIRSQTQGPIVGLTNGDAFYNGFFRPSFHRPFEQASEAADVVFSTSMGETADRLVARTGCRMALSPWGVCQARFTDPDLQRTQPEFRVVFIGSTNRARNPLKSYHWLGRRREALVRKLTARFGDGFGLFGNGWEGNPSWHGPVPFAEQQDACRRGQVVVGGLPFSPARYYTSDRTYIQIASGRPFIDLAVEGTERLLRNDEHWYPAATVDEIVDRCDELLSRPPAQLEEAGRVAADHLRRQHTMEHRFRSLVSTLADVRRAVRRGDRAPLPDLSFFLPEVDITAELPMATRGWGPSPWA
jgi:hypothetical protein